MTDHDGDFVRAALTAAADAGVPDTERIPAWPPPLANAGGRRWQGDHRFVALLAAAAVVLVVGAVATVVAITRPDSGRPVAPAPLTTSAPQPEPSPPPTPVSSPSDTAPPTPPSSAPLTPPAKFVLGYQPLWPFVDRGAAAAWEQQHAATGVQPWHLDASATALAFTTGYLGFIEINRVVATSTDELGAHVSVGYLDPNGTPHSAAVLHLVRFGPTSSSPWEVVGSDDGDFSIESPPYGSVGHSPLTVGGHITGVDESIRVSVRQLSTATPIGQACCLPAGGVHSPWSVSVTYPSVADPVLTLVASTGGHLQEVERFAIHGVRTR